MTKVICCYTQMEKRSRLALNKYAPQVEMVNTSRSIWAYGEEIAKRWLGEEDLVIIEGDKEITADVLPSFDRCDLPWCNFSSFVFVGTAMEREVFTGLGCTKYSAFAQQSIRPDDFICPDVGYVCKICAGKGCWNNLDGRIASALRKCNIDVHIHGRVNHHHDYSENSPVFQLPQIKEVLHPETHRKSLEIAGPYWRGRLD